MDYPNYRQCCATCTNWKDAKRVVIPDRKKVTTDTATACCQMFNGISTEMSAGRGGCPKYKKLLQLLQFKGNFTPQKQR